MNREIQSLSEKLFFRLIQCISPKVASDDNTYHNDLDRNLQIGVFLAFSSQCHPSVTLCKIFLTYFFIYFTSNFCFRTAVYNAYLSKIRYETCNL